MEVHNENIETMKRLHKESKELLAITLASINTSRKNNEKHYGRLIYFVLRISNL